MSTTLTTLRRALPYAALLGLFIAIPSCTSDSGSGDDQGNSTGGGSGTAGSATGGISGSSTGGASGASTGGTSGASTGGISGASTGGTSGASTGGASGATTGGTAGDSGSGGTATGGTGGAAGSGGSAGAGGAGSVFPPGVTTPKIMIVGDSISAGPGCYKKYLNQNLMTNGITNYEFVGEYTDDCGGGVRHSAVSCTTTANYTMATFTIPNCNTNTYPGLATLVATHNPDLIMLQLGVNDVWGGSAPIPPILANYATLVNQARAHNPRIVVMVAQIHKIITDTCTNMASTTNAEQLVMAVPAWAAGITTANSPVLVADLWTNSDPHQSADCVHPDDAGAQRMGMNWYNALAPILR